MMRALIVGTCSEQEAAAEPLEDSAPSPPLYDAWPYTSDDVGHCTFNPMTQLPTGAAQTRAGYLII